MGKTGKILVDITLVGSQVGFVTAYTGFISQNLQSVIFNAFGAMVPLWAFGKNLSMTV